MAVRSINQWQPVPGREADTLAAFSEAKRIQEQMGARCRAWNNVLSGEGPTVFAYTVEVDSLPDYFTLLEGLRNSKEFRAVLQSVVQVANPAATRAGAFLTAEFPGMEAGPFDAAPGALVASVFQWQVKPGQLEEVLSRGRESVALATAMGATVSGWRNLYAGAASGTIAMGFFFNGYPAMAEFQRKAAANADWAAMQTRHGTPDAPNVLVSSGLFAELRI